MSAPFALALVLFLLFGSVSIDSFWLRGDAELLARENVDSLVREDDPANVSAIRAIRVGGRNTKLPRPAVATANGFLPLLLAASGAPFASTAKTRQLHLFTVLRV
jgi:hypothetical protein